jgi:hypothetical protein
LVVWLIYGSTVKGFTNSNPSTVLKSLTFLVANLRLFMIAVAAITASARPIFDFLLSSIALWEITSSRG